MNEVREEKAAEVREVRRGTRSRPSERVPKRTHSRTKAHEVREGTPPYRGVPGVPVPDFTAWNDIQTAYITHAMRCPRCTAAARLPGAKRCRPGASLWQQYLAALPEPVRYDSDKRKPK